MNAWKNEWNLFRELKFLEIEFSIVIGYVIIRRLFCSLVSCVCIEECIKKGKYI